MNNSFRNINNPLLENRAYRMGKMMRLRSERMRATWNSMTTAQQIFVILGIILVCVILYFLYKYKSEQEKLFRFSTQPLFMTGIEKNEPHDSTQIYEYTNPETNRTTPYIPRNLLRETTSNQYTISFWMFINNNKWSHNFNEWKHVFHRGTKPDIGSQTQGKERQISELDRQLPGFWLAPKLNNLHCILTTRGGQERIVLEDIDLNKWINIVLTVDERAITLYKDGKLERTITLFQPMDVSNNNVYVNYYGGFAGNMAYLQFFNTVLTPSKIQNMYNDYRNNVDKYVIYRRNEILFGDGVDENEKDM